MYRNTIDRRPTMGVAVETKTKYTPEDLLAMPDGKSYELVDGQLVERKMGVESSWVTGRLHSRLDRFCQEHGTGWVVQADCGYQCFLDDPSRVRRPEVSFVRYGRFPSEVLPKGWAKIAPDLAVKVVSPNETAYEVDEKLTDYQKAGVPLVWVINPNSSTVRVHRGDGSVSYLREDEELSGEDVIPGFRCMVREFLPPHQPSQELEPNSTAPNGPR
jgi:Uma2 family endonuclease